MDARIFTRGYHRIIPQVAASIYLSIKNCINEPLMQNKMLGTSVPRVSHAEVIEFWIDESGVWDILTNVYQNTDTYELQVNPNNLGSTVFFTREEAEEKLKKN